MIFDKQNLISDDQAITVTAVSTDKIDRRGGHQPTGTVGGYTTDSLGNTVPNQEGKTPDLCMVYTVTEQFTAAGAATLTIATVSDDDSALGTPTTLATTGAIGKAALKPGYQVIHDLPPNNAVADRYLGATYTVATGPMTAGKITAGIMAKSSVQSAPGTFF